MKKKIVSIFSGIDCLGLGFRNEFDIILAVEKEKKACETLIKNREKFHPSLEVLNEDILSIPDNKIEEYRGVDGIIGGPPCQAFSSARGAFDPNDARIQCLFEYVRWVKIIQPKFFMFENVKGLLEKTKLSIFEHFIELLENLGYKIQFKILNSHDYGSVQKRERVVAVGFQEELDIDFKFPKPLTTKKLVKDIIVEGEDIGECAKYDAKKMEVVPHIPEGGNWRSLKTEELLRKALLGNYEKRQGGMTGVYKRLDRNGHCPTLTTCPTQRNTMAIHPLEDRPLSIKECKRAQGIPEDYELVGSVSQKYKFIGNGVPVEMASCISQSINEAILKYEYMNKEELSSTLDKNTVDNTDKEDTFYEYNLDEITTVSNNNQVMFTF